MYGRGERIWGECRQPCPVGSSSAADLGYDQQPVGVRSKGTPDELVGDMRAVVVRAVDVIDLQRDRLAQHRERSVDVARRSPDAWTSQLHGAITHAIQGHVAARQR